MQTYASACLPGDLVRPSLGGLGEKKIMYLTPLGDPDMEDWPRWFANEFAIVLSCSHLEGTYTVLTLDGVGICFADELEVIQQWK